MVLAWFASGPVCSALGSGREAGPGQPSLPAEPSRARPLGAGALGLRSLLPAPWAHPTENTAEVKRILYTVSCLLK